MAERNTAIEINSDSLRVKANGIGANELDLTDTYDYATAGGTVQVSTPSADNDAVNKSYVDGVAAGLDWKDSVRVATTSPGTLTLSGGASDFENGKVVDGVTLATGDRILLKDQADGSENGIYTVNSSGAPTRSTDADEDSEVTAGLAVFVEEGTTNADRGYVLTTDDPITVDTTSLTFTQFTGLGQIVAGDGLSKTGDTLDVNVDDSTLEINADTLRIKDDGVTEAKLDVLDTPNDGEVLSFDSGTGRLEWISNEPADTVKEADYVANEVPTGVIDSVNDTFTIANTPVTGSVEVYLNGMLQAPGGSEDYTISGTTITFNKAPTTNSTLLVSYIIDN